METSQLEFASNFGSNTLNYFIRIERAISYELNRFSDTSFYEPLTYAIENGKRIRPLILLLSHDATCNDLAQRRDPMPAAIAVELLHTESLIHDDIIDQDTCRRGKDTFHVKYGLELSILSANFVVGIVLELASQYANKKVAHELSTAVLRMTECEQSELKIQAERAPFKTSQYISLIGDKTGSLFQTCAKLGAITSGATEQTIEHMSDYGLNLGIAYQIQDDLLDWDQDQGPERCVGEDKFILRKMSNDFALSAIKSVSYLPDSDPKRRLCELAKFAIGRRF